MSIHKSHCIMNYGWKFVPILHAHHSLFLFLAPSCYMLDREKVRLVPLIVVYYFVKRHFPLIKTINVGKAEVSLETDPSNLVITERRIRHNQLLHCFPAYFANNAKNSYHYMHMDKK